MKAIARIAALPVAVFVAVAPLSAQRHTAIVSLYGGGAEHFRNLTTQTSGPDFKPGYDIGASVGLQLTQIFAVHADFTYTRNQARGESPFAGADVNRFFYGAHLEARYPMAFGLTPFAFAGGGAVSVDQLGIDRFEPFTRPAGMFGAGLFFAVPRTPIELFGEYKTLVYNWNRAGFDRTLMDFTYSGGVSYKLSF